MADDKDAEVSPEIVALESDPGESKKSPDEDTEASALTLPARRASVVGASLAVALEEGASAKCSREIRKSFALVRGLDEKLPFGGDLLAVRFILG